MKYLDFYNKCVITKELPDDGLCNCGVIKIDSLLKPTEEDIEQLRFEGYAYTYWGSLGKEDDSVAQRERYRSFTPLRQNIVLLLACLNGEL